MYGSPNHETSDELLDALNTALASGTREAFTALLTDDVRWGGEQRGGNDECTTREQAGDHYVSLLASGLRLSVTQLSYAEELTDGVVLTARVRITAPDAADYPAEMMARLKLRSRRIADICISDVPPSIEVLYFEGCPHYDVFLPHLYELLDENAITAAVTLIRIDNDEQATAQRFLGSPTVRVNGVDIEPGSGQRPVGSVDIPVQYGRQCRLYRADDGTTGVPRDQWILDALADNPIHEPTNVARDEG